MSHDLEEWCKIWRKTDLLFLKWQEFGEFWPKHCTLIGSYFAKYLMFDRKKYRGVIFQDTEQWCKIWRKINLWFGKWHEEFGKFSPEHWKVSKLGLSWDLFSQSRKCMRLKFTEELCVMTMKNDTKIEEELTCRFKIDMRNWMNFDPSTRPKYIMLELKKYRGVIFHDTEEWCKIWRKTDLWFGKWHEEFGKFLPDDWKVSKLGLSWDPFVQNRKCMSLKFTEELCVMTMKNDAKFEEELTCQFKIDMRNLTNFDPSTRKSQKCAL